jgi:hypothetical protein
MSSLDREADVSFKAHDDGRGPRLGRQVRLGPSGMARRFSASESEGGVQQQHAGPKTETGAPMTAGERKVAERGTGSGEASVKALGAESTGKRGRPKVEGDRPWEAEGMSRRTWYRRRKEGG